MSGAHDQPRDDRRKKGNGDPRRGADGRPAPDDGSAALAELSRQFRELLQGASELARVWVDRTRIGIREAGWLALFGAWAALLAIVLSIGAAALVLGGLSGALAFLMGGLEWAGDLAAGALVLIVMGLGLVIARSLSRRRAFKRTVEKYRRNERQRADRSRGPARSET